MIKTTIKFILTAAAAIAALVLLSCRGVSDTPDGTVTVTGTEETTLTTTDITDLSDYPKNTAPDPRNPGDLLVYLCSVADYGAVADGKTDNTAAFQNALDYVRSQGGGTVYVPAGFYNFTGTLKIPRSVYLAGAWYDPDTEPDKAASGTVLLVSSSKGDADGTPFITVGASAGVIGLTFYYPDQSVDENGAIPYPATLLIMDNWAGDSTQHAATISCVTLANSYFGIDGTRGNQLFYLNTARITAFDRGFAVNKCYDCGRTMNLTVSPRYFAAYTSASGGDGDAALSAASAAMKKNVTGIVMMRTDWQMMYKTTVESCRVGVSCERNPDSAEETAGNGSLIDFTIKDCNIGVDCYYGSFQFSLGTIDCTGDGAVAVRVNDTVVGNFNFYDCNIASDGNGIETVGGGTGVLSVQNCDFSRWNGYAIKHSGGSAELQSSTFSGTGDAIYAAETASTLVCGGNTFADTVTAVLTNKISRENASAVDDKSSPLDKVDFSFDIGTPPVIASVKNIVYVTDFGATGKAVCGGNSSDDTSAFERAISAVSEDGGIVYVPAGYYNVAGTLDIPSGVELRGISQSLHVTTGEGSVIFVTSGKGEEEGTPFITLEEGAGLRGLTFWYPEQNYTKIVKYPWMIRAEGHDVYIRDICVGNCYQAIDLASADCGGHWVENVTGCVLKNGIAVNGSTKAGYIINTHFNLSFYTAVWGTKLTDASGSFGDSAMFTTLLGTLNSNLTAYSFGITTDETVLYAFNYRAAVGMRFTGGFDGRLCGSGVDGSIVGLYVTGVYQSPLRLLNFSDDIVPGSNKIGNVGIYIDADESSEIAIVSSSASSYNNVPPFLVTLVSGNLSLRGFCANVSPLGSSAAILVKGGEATVSGITFRHVGKLDSDGAFTEQTEKSRAVDVRVKGGKLSLRGATAKYFFVYKEEGGELAELNYTVTP